MTVWNQSIRGWWSGDDAERAADAADSLAAQQGSAIVSVDSEAEAQAVRFALDGMRRKDRITVKVRK